MKRLHFALLCLLLLATSAFSQVNSKTLPVEFRVTTLSNTISPTSSAKFEVALINRSDKLLWLCHDWYMNYYGTGKDGEHMLIYPFAITAPPTKDAFVRLLPSEGILYHAEIPWGILTEEDKKPGKKIFVIKAGLAPGNRLGIDAWSGELSAKVELNILKD